MKNKKSQIELTTGIYIRSLGLLIIMIAAPSVVVNPTNITAQIILLLGEFILVIGGFIKWLNFNLYHY